MGVSAITPNQAVLREVFANFYAVPAFQREYVWTRKHVTKLLEDLYQAYRTGGADNYFLGSIVFYEEDGFRRLIDGQQRITTLYLLIAAIRDRQLTFDDPADVTVQEGAIFSHHRQGTKNVPRFRVQLQFPELSEVLERLGSRKKADDKISVPRGRGALRNLYSAYALCLDFLTKSFAAESSDLEAFFTFLWDQVELITIESTNVQSAYTIFETLNYRGQTLNAADLLKNLLFRETTDSAQRDKIIANWKAVVTELKEGKETQPTRFLRYFLVANYDTKRMLSASSLFEWLIEKENAKQLGYGSDPVGFSKLLLENARVYARFLNSKSPRGTRNEHLERIEFQRTGVRQHLCLLLAARKAPEPAFESLCEAIEALVFIYATTKQQWNKLESDLPAWTKELRGVTTASQMENFIASNIRPRIDQRRTDFCDRLKNMQPVARNLQLYLLARISQKIADEIGRGGRIARYFEEKLTIEHIYPQRPDDAARTEFGPKQDDAFYTYQLGNLALLSGPDNPTLGNLPYTEKLKKKLYEQDYVLTQSLVTDLRGGKGKETMRNKTVSKYGICTYASWNPVALKDRHQMMLRVVSELWGLDVSGCSA